MRVSLAFVLAALLLSATAAAAASRATPEEAIAAQFLKEISESKAHGITVRCVRFPDESSKGFIIFGAARLRGHTLYLSERYDCEPLAYIRAHELARSIPLASVDAVKTVAHEWFHTRGVASESKTECDAVRYTWKWVRRMGYTAAFRARARAHLLDNSHGPAEYKLNPACTLTPGSR